MSLVTFLTDFVNPLFHFIIQMIILVIIACITLTQQTETALYHLLTIDFQTNSSRDYQKLEKLIKQTTTGGFVSMKYLNCTELETCPRFKIYDAFGDLMEQYDGISSFSRYMDMIERGMKANNYPIIREDDTERLKDGEISMKVFEERRKLSKIEKSEDWEKASPTQKKKNRQQHKPENHVHKTSRDMRKVIKGNLRDEESHEQGSSKEDAYVSKNEEPKSSSLIQGKEAPIFKDVEHVFAWKIAFIFMNVGLYFGMKYLKHQQKRIKKLNSTSIESHSEGESFNSE